MARTTTTAKLARKSQRAEPSPLPDWQSPRKPQPTDAITPPEVKLTVLQQAHAITGLNADPAVIAAVILSLSVDKLCKALVEAAAISQYHRGA